MILSGVHQQFLEDSGTGILAGGNALGYTLNRLKVT
jgi:hypothetical protein